MSICRPLWKDRNGEHTWKNFRVGGLVLLADENHKRGKWPTARVVEVVVVDDVCVRMVKVKTASTVATHVKDKDAER